MFIYRLQLNENSQNIGEFCIRLVTDCLEDGKPLFLFISEEEEFSKADMNEERKSFIEDMAGNLNYYWQFKNNFSMVVTSNIESI